MGEVFYLKHEVHDDAGFIHNSIRRNYKIKLQKSVTNIRLVRTKIFQFETLFCHVITNEILHMNCVFSLVYAKSHC